MIFPNSFAVLFVLVSELHFIEWYNSACLFRYEGRIHLCIPLNKLDLFSTVQRPLAATRQMLSPNHDEYANLGYIHEVS